MARRKAKTDDEPAKPDELKLPRPRPTTPAEMRRYERRGQMRFTGLDPDQGGGEQSCQTVR